MPGALADASPLRGMPPLLSGKNDGKGGQVSKRCSRIMYYKKLEFS